MILDGSASKQMNDDVDVRLAEEQPHLGALGRRLALLGILLREGRVRLDRLPDGVVDLAVDGRGCGFLGELAGRRRRWPRDRRIGAEEWRRSF